MTEMTKLADAVRMIERFFGGLESFNLLDPKIRDAWGTILFYLAVEEIRKR